MKKELKKKEKKIAVCPKTYSGHHIWAEVSTAGVMLDEGDIERIFKCIACGIIDDSYIDL